MPFRSADIFPADEKLTEKEQKLLLLLKGAEERMRGMIDATLDGVIVIGEDNRIRIWNRNVEQIFGWAEAEAVGYDMTDLIIPRAYRDRHRAGMKRFLDSGAHEILNQRIEISGLHKNGSEFPIELTVTPQKDIDGRYTFIAFVRDISDRKKFEKRQMQRQAELEKTVQQSASQLQLQEGFLRTVIDAVVDPIFVKDRQHRWIEGNKAFWNLIGPEEEMKGKTDYDLFPADIADKFWEGDEKVFAGEMFDEEEDIINADGGKRIIATKKVALRLPNGEECLVGVIRDVSEQHAFEGELRRHRDHLQEMVAAQTRDLVAAKERAEEANNAKTEFLANMSHELRTPMNVVIGLANILSMSQPLTPKQQEFISTLQVSANSLLGLLNDLLDISKIEGRSVDLEIISFSLDALMQEVADMMAVRVNEKKLFLTVDTDAVRGRWYKGDPTRLRQVIVNLVGNAVKFTETGGIGISVVSDISSMDGHDRLCISVEDTGIGIPPEKRQAVFDKFVQADASINRKYGGTGLGLSIARTLVEIMGGSLNFESEMGKGSVFRVWLDLPHCARPEQAHETHAAAAPAAEAGKTVLIVEDHAPNVLVVASYLEQWGYRHDLARTGVEAVEKIISGNKYMAILMDIQMQGMSGLEATRIIRQYERNALFDSVPIIGMTAHAVLGDREKCLYAGMTDYISKPFNPADLQAKLTAISDSVDGEKAAGPKA